MLNHHAPGYRIILCTLTRPHETWGLVNTIDDNNMI
jgi:hypothetical protein